MASGGSVIPTTAEKAYRKAKQKYRQDMGVLAKTLDDLKIRKLKPREAKKNAQGLNERIDAVKKLWVNIEDTREDSLEEKGKQDFGNEEWRNGETHSFVDEILKKDALLMEADEIVDDLEGNTDDGPAFIRAVSSRQEGMNSPLAPMDDIKTTLSKVEVSKTDFESFGKQLSERKVVGWKEDALCKMVNGLDKENFEEFLDLFQAESGIAETVKSGIKASVKGLEGSTTVKFFNCEGNDLEGKYGIYAVKQYRDKEEKDKIDFGYSLFSFSTTLFAKQKKKGILLGRDSAGDDVRPDRCLKVKDINGLTENFIIVKALSGFANAGLIPCVRWVEDQTPSAAIESA